MEGSIQDLEKNLKRLEVLVAKCLVIAKATEGGIKTASIFKLNPRPKKIGA